MENYLILTSLLVVLAIGIFIFAYKADPKGFFRSVFKESIWIIFSFFFGLFGFSLELFDRENE